MSCDPSSLAKRIAIPLATLTPNASAPTGGAATVWMSNPSALLIAHIALVLQPIRGNATAFSSAADWQIWPCVPSADNDSFAPQPLQPVFTTARVLPDGFVVDDPIRLIKIVANLYSNIEGAGTIWAIATWEGKDACLDAGLRAALFALCTLTCDNGGSPLALLAGPGV